MKKIKKENTTDITLGRYHRYHIDIIECFQMGVEGKYDDMMLEIYVFVFKNTFYGKINNKKKIKIVASFALMLDFLKIFSNHVNIFKTGPEIHKKLRVERTRLQICQAKSDIDWKYYYCTRK